MHEDRKLDFELLTGCSSIDTALVPALQVWNAFWGPLGSKHIRKETLIDNKDLLFALVEAVVPSLISNKIQLEDEYHDLLEDMNTMREEQLTAFQVLTETHKSQCYEVDFEDQDDEEEPHNVDDRDIVRKSPPLPKWNLVVQMTETKHLAILITHDEYYKYFPEVPCKNLDA